MYPFFCIINLIILLQRNTESYWRDSPGIHRVELKNPVVRWGQLPSNEIGATTASPVVNVELGLDG